MYHKEGQHGYCSYLDGPERPGIFEIGLNGSLPLESLTTAVAHEITHVKQWHKGQMYDYQRSNNIRWHGKVFSEKTIKKKNYWFEPWEIEAYGMQRGLVMTYVEKHKDIMMKKPWVKRLCES